MTKHVTSLLNFATHPRCSAGLAPASLAVYKSVMSSNSTGTSQGTVTLALCGSTFLLVFMLAAMISGVPENRLNLKQKPIDATVVEIKTLCTLAGRCTSEAKAQTSTEVKTMCSFLGCKESKKNQSKKRIVPFSFRGKPEVIEGEQIQLIFKITSTTKDGGKFGHYELYR